MPGICLGDVHGANDGSVFLEDLEYVVQVPAVQGIIESGQEPLDIFCVGHGWVAEPWQRRVDAYICFVVMDFLVDGSWVTGLSLFILAVSQSLSIDTVNCHLVDPL